jgi:hypothetical protein
MKKRRRTKKIPFYQKLGDNRKPKKKPSTVLQLMMRIASPATAIEHSSKQCFKRKRKPTRRAAFSARGQVSTESEKV